VGYYTCKVTEIQSEAQASIPNAKTLFGKAGTKRPLTQSRKPGRQENLSFSGLNPNDLAFLCELGDLARGKHLIHRRGRREKAVHDHRH
jgi:hypothetical protein